jgi:hypothetical protein
MGNNQSNQLNEQNIIKALQNISTSNPAVPAQCNWRDQNQCIFKDYVFQGNGTCAGPPGNGNPTYSGLYNYNEQQLSDWLQTLYNRNSGNDPSKGEAAAVFQYWNTCKNAPGYEFLQKLNLTDPTKNNSNLLSQSQQILDNYVDERRTNFKNLQELQLVRDDLFKKVQLLQSRQDLYLESARLNEVDNTRKLEELDKDISVRRRQVMYDFESDMVYNSKIYFLGNITFYLILFIIGIMIYRRFLSQ